MILNLLTWGWLALLTYLYGWTLLRLSQDQRDQSAIALPISLRLLVGVGGLAAGVSYLSVVMPIGTAAQGIGSVGAIALALLQRRALAAQVRHDLAQLRQPAGIAGSLVILLALLLTFQSAVGPYNYDTGLYHLQSVKWIEQYRAVPGLGNIHGRLAFGSLLFPLAALSSLDDLLPERLHSINGFILLLGLLFALSNLSQLRRGTLSPARLFQLMLAVPLVLLIYDGTRFSVEVSSFSTDLPVAVLTLVTLGVGVQYGDQVRALRDREETLPVSDAAETGLLACTVVILVATAIGMKLSALPLGLLALYVMVQEFRRGRRRFWLWAVVVGTGIWLPQILRTAIASGYLIYPLYQVDVLRVDWKIPLERVIRERQALGSWTKAGDVPLEVLQEMGWAWFPGWLQRFMAGGVFQGWVVAIATLVGSLGVARSPTQRLLWHWRGLYGWLLFGTLFWFFTAPDVRLAYGILTGWTVALTVPLVGGVMSRLAVKRRLVVRLAYPAVLIGIAIANFNFYPDDIAFFIMPMPFPPAMIESSQIGDFTLYHPIEGDQCWGAPLPCAPVPNPALELRGESLQAGFRLPPEG